jgi:hypothetical protein
MKLLIKTILALLGSTLVTTTSYATMQMHSQAVQTKPFINIESSTDAELKKQDVLTEKKKQVIKEAADAVNATQAALKALNGNDSQQTKAALEVATGNLHLLRANNTDLDLIPVDAQARAFHLNMDMQQLKKLQAKVNKLIDEHSYQAARPLIDSMSDEIRVHAVYMPLKTYSPAIDAIVLMMSRGEITQAKKSLYAALNQLVFEEEIIPLPILRAEALIEEASEIEHNSVLSKQEAKHAVRNLVGQASDQINISEEMGYGVKSDYSDLKVSIGSLKKEIGTGDFQVKWNKFKSVVSAFKRRLVHPAG